LSYSNLTYDRKSVSYHYPQWAICVGWMMAAASIIWIPLVAIYRLCQAKGSLKQVNVHQKHYTHRINVT